MRNDLNFLQGTWAITELEMEGQTISRGMLANARVEISGNRFRSTGMGAVYEGTLILNAKSTPSQLDMRFDAGPEKGNTNLGIYVIDRNSWKLCLATGGSVRPSEFAAPTGSGFVCETLSRVAPANESPSEAPKQSHAASKTEFEGEWQMVSAVMDGLPMEPSAAQWVKRLTRGNETTVTAGPQVMMKMEFVSDGSQSPKTIDYINTAGPHKGKTQLAIYQFEGDLLTICTAPPGAPRPATFQSERGSGRTLTIWKRR